MLQRKRDAVGWKNDPIKLIEQKKKEILQYWKTEQEKNQWKLISDMTTWEQRKKGNIWNENKREHRERQNKWHLTSLWEKLLLRIPSLDCRPLQCIRSMISVLWNNEESIMLKYRKKMLHSLQRQGFWRLLESLELEKK